MERDSERFETHINGHLDSLWPALHDARDIFNLAACNLCLLTGGNDRMHCFVYDREQDRIVRVVRIHSGNDVVFAAYASKCEACGTEFFDIDMTDTLCVDCSQRVAA